MPENSPEPLWREVVGDTEPWRKGRIFLIVFAILAILNQALLFGVMVLNGAIEILFAFGIAAALFWLLFYLIWIGIHWVRWFTAFWWGAWGFFLLIWSFQDSNFLEMISGSYAVVVGAFLGFSPPIYFFAQHQRETRRLWETLGVGAVVLILILSLTIALAGLSQYKKQLQLDARSFADQAFARIFTRHDTYFLLDVASDDIMKKEGRNGLTRFLQHATIYAGEVREIRPAQASLWFSYAFPATLVAHADVASEGTSSRGLLELHMRIEQPAKDWRIDNVWWFDQHSIHARGSQNR